MTEGRIEFEDALREAQAKGFAEADPTLDIDGHDAAQKLKILTELAFSAQVNANAVQVEGIREIDCGRCTSGQGTGFRDQACGDCGIE